MDKWKKIWTGNVNVIQQKFFFGEFLSNEVTSTMMRISDILTFNLHVIALQNLKSNMKYSKVKINLLPTRKSKS